MIDPGGIPWGDIGKGIGAVVLAAFGYIAGKGKRKVSAAADDAAVSDYSADAAASGAATAQIRALLDRVAALEKSHAQMWDEQRQDKLLIIKLQVRQAQLEGILRQHSIPVPPETA